MKKELWPVARVWKVCPWAVPSLGTTYSLLETDGVLGRNWNWETMTVDGIPYPLGTSRNIERELTL